MYFEVSTVYLVYKKLFSYYNNTKDSQAMHILKKKKKSMHSHCINIIFHGIDKKFVFVPLSHIYTVLSLSEAKIDLNTVFHNIRIIQKSTLQLINPRLNS